MSRILVVGAYEADKPNTQQHLHETFAASRDHHVDQYWIALHSHGTRTPKYRLLNLQLASIGIDDHDVVIVTDDDIRLEEGWLDGYLAVQGELGFALAQPARTPESHYWHEITRQQVGNVARETRFVEIGPLFSVTRAAYPYVFPFDERSPHGFGYEFVWAGRFHDAGLRMGIVDAWPVDHTLRPHGETFDYREAERDMDSLLAQQWHLPREDCFVTLEHHRGPAAQPTRRSA